MTWFLPEALSNIDHFGPRELFREDEGAVRSARIKKGDGPVHVHHLERSIHFGNLPDSRRRNDSPLPLSSATAGNDTYSGTSSGDGNIVWFCPLCNAPQQGMEMLGFDLCDEWFCFRGNRQASTGEAEVILS